MGELNVPIAIIAHPKVPHFGGTKHWHPAYTFLVLFAGSGVVLVATHLGRALAEWTANRRARASNAATPLPLSLAPGEPNTES